MKLGDGTTNGTVLVRDVRNIANTGDEYRSMINIFLLVITNARTMRERKFSVNLDFFYHRTDCGLIPELWNCRS